MVDWLIGCQVCDEALCKHFEKLMGEGLSQRQAAKKMIKEQKDELGIIIFTENSLRGRYLRNSINVKKKNKRKKVDQNDPLKCIDCLNTLFDEGEKFRTVYADPPWQYDNQGTRACTNNHYETMTIEEIATLPIERLTEEDAHLHLWTRQ